LFAGADHDWSDRRPGVEPQRPPVERSFEQELAVDVIELMMLGKEYYRVTKRAPCPSTHPLQCVDGATVN